LQTTLPKAPREGQILHYDGSFEVNSPTDVVYDFIADPAKVSTILPDVQDFKITDHDDFSMKAKMGISFVKGLMDVKCTFTEKTPFTFLKLKANANGLSSVVELEASFALKDGEGGGTVVRWAADAKIAGLLARVGSRLIDSATQKYVTEMINSLRQKLTQ
jgi:carbon monoxide dehydrogenase subunit G